MRGTRRQVQVLAAAASCGPPPGSGRCCRLRTALRPRRAPPELRISRPSRARLIGPPGSKSGRPGAPRRSRPHRARPPAERAPAPCQPRLPAGFSSTPGQARPLRGSESKRATEGGGPRPPGGARAPLPVPAAPAATAAAASAAASRAAACVTLGRQSPPCAAAGPRRPRPFHRGPAPRVRPVTSPLPLPQEPPPAAAWAPAPGSCPRAPESCCSPGPASFPLRLQSSETKGVCAVPGGPRAVHPRNRCPPSG